MIRSPPTHFVDKFCGAAMAGLLTAYALAMGAQDQPASSLPPDINAPATGMMLDLGQRHEQLEVIQVTPEYSNAVLKAVLPYISDVAQKLDLPVAKPVTAEYVVHCSVHPRRSVGAEVGILGGWVFQFNFGFVKVIQSSHSYYILQDPDEIPSYFGEVRMSRTEAIQLARDTIRKLGIPLEAVFAEQEPRVTEPPKIGTNTVPHYRIEWLNPVQTVVGEVDIEINGNAKHVERIAFGPNKSLERPPPRVAIALQPDPRFPHHAPLANPEYALQLIPIVLGAIDEYGEKLSLPLPRPLTTNHVARFSLGESFGGGPYSEIELTNGWRFLYENSMVTSYTAPDALFGMEQHGILLKDYVGKWNLTEANAIELIRRTVAKLGYPTNLVHMDFEPRLSKPAVPGIPRYMFRWYYSLEGDSITRSAVCAEVDGDKGELKSLYYGNIDFWKLKPKISVPMMLPTPDGSNGSPMKSSVKPPAQGGHRKLLDHPVPLPR